jgi:hypothetical protein
MAVTKPDRLHYTGNDEADALLAHDPFALLVGFALDQQVPVPTAFQGPLKLKQRLGTLDPGQIAATDPAGSKRSSARSRRSTASPATWPAHPGPAVGRDRGVRRRR